MAAQRIIHIYTCDRCDAESDNAEKMKQVRWSNVAVSRAHLGGVDNNIVKDLCEKCYADFSEHMSIFDPKR